MRVPISLIAVATAFVLASSARMPTAPAVASTAAVATAPVANSEQSKTDATTDRGDWYTDPIAIGLGLVAIFAIVDIAVMLTKGAQRTGPRVLGPR